jgi:hypothetical protein
MATLDKSWFCLFDLHDHTWLRPGEEASARPKHTLGDGKVMVTIGFGANFHIMFALPKGQKLNVTSYADVILRRVLDSGLKAGGNQLIIHANNVRLHTAQMVPVFSEENQFQRPPHSAYSPDLAPCYFDLFGHITLRLKERQFSSGKSSSRRFKKILNEIAIDTLVRIFTEWEGELRWVIDNNGEYYRRGN